VLRDTDSKILLDPANKRIQLKNAAGELKAFIAADENLSNRDGNNIVINSSNRPGSSVGAPSPPASSGLSGTEYVDGTPTYSSSAGSFTPTVSGQYELFDLFDTSSIPTIDLSAAATAAGLNTPVPHSTGNPNGNLTGSYHQQIYSTAAGPKRISQTISLVVEKVSTGEEVRSVFLAYAEKSSAVSAGNRYYWNSSTNSWDNSSWPGQAADSNSYAVNTPINTFATLEAGVTYRIRYKSVLSTSSGYQGYLDGTSWTRSYTYYTVTNSGGWSGQALSGLDQAFGLAIPSNFVEISGGGIQAVTNSEKYVSIVRRSVSDNGERGYAQFQRADKSDLSLWVEGKAQFERRVDVGIGSAGNTSVNTYNWPGLRTRMLTIQPKYVGPGNSNSSVPLDLAYEIRSGGSTLYLRPGSSGRYYTLPHISSAGTTTDANYVPDGTIITLINTSNIYSGYVKGLFGANGGTKEYYTLKHGDCLTLQYFGGSSYQLSGWTSGDTKGWFILSYAYNQESY
jgi:hypothetical protein